MSDPMDCYYAPFCDRRIVEAGEGHVHVEPDGTRLGSLRWTLGLGNRPVAHSARPAINLETGQQ